MTAPAKDVIRIDATGDLRCPRTPDDVLRCIFGHADDEADVPLLCGDLTDYGKPEEALVFAQLLASSRRSDSCSYAADLPGPVASLYL